ncbi:hypothetical protein TNIN_196181, partial [Trichonephila inaurata madagascariensis]
MYQFTFVVQMIEDYLSGVETQNILGQDRQKGFDDWQRKSTRNFKQDHG